MDDSGYLTSTSWILPAVGFFRQLERPIAIGGLQAAPDLRFPTCLAGTARARDVAEDGDVADAQRHFLGDQAAEGASERRFIHSGPHRPRSFGIEPVVGVLVSQQYRSDAQRFVVLRVAASRLRRPRDGRVKRRHGLRAGRRGGGGTRHLQSDGFNRTRVRERPHLGDQRALCLSRGLSRRLIPARDRRHGADAALPDGRSWSGWRSDSAVRLCRDFPWLRRPRAQC